MLRLTHGTDISIREMRIHCQHGKIKRFFLLRNLKQLFFRHLEETPILKSPEYIIVLRNLSILQRPVVVINRIISMLRKIVSTSAKDRIRPNHQIVMIPFCFQQLSQRCHARKERGIFSHRITIYRHFQRQPRRLRKHARNSPSCVFDLCGASQCARQEGKMQVLPGQLCQFWYQILLEKPAILL